VQGYEGAQEQFCKLTEHPMQAFARLRKDMQAYARLFDVFRKRTNVRIPTRLFRGADKAIQAYTRVYKDIQGYAAFFQNTKFVLP
jgi:hypothetical protein